MLDIILPFWGEPAYLYEAVDSVLAQTSDAWHLTILDDCYPDPGVAEHFAALDDPRVEYRRNEHNLGITDNYRLGLSLATRPYLMFMGCDDVMEPDYVATLLAAAQRWPAAELFQPGVRVIDEHGAVYEPLADKIKKALRPAGETFLAGEGAATSLLRGNWLYWPSLMFKTDALSAVSFLDGFPLVQDLGVELDILRAGGRLVVLPDEVFRYRRHAASASSAKLLDGGRFADERAFFEIQAHTMAAAGWPRAARAARAHLTSRLYAAALLPQAAQQRSIAGARTLLRHVLRTSR